MPAGAEIAAPNPDLLESTPVPRQFARFAPSSLFSLPLSTSIVIRARLVETAGLIDL